MLIYFIRQYTEMATLLPLNLLVSLEYMCLLRTLAIIKDIVDVRDSLCVVFCIIICKPQHKMPQCTETWRSTWAVGGTKKGELFFFTPVHFREAFLTVAMGLQWPHTITNLDIIPMTKK